MRAVRPPRRALRRALRRGVVGGVLGGLLTAVALLGLSAGTQVASAVPAGACAQDTKTRIGGAIRYNDDVFIGTVADTTRMRGGKILLVDVDVKSVRKGDLSPSSNDTVRVEVFPISDRRAYEGLPRVDRTYVFFARDARVGLAASPCGGYQLATDDVVALLDKIRPEPTESETPTATLSPPTDGTPGPPAPVAQIIAPGLALAVVGGLGLLVVGVTGRKP